MTLASELDDEEWKFLSALLGRSRIERTGYQIAKEVWPESEEATRLGTVTRFLESFEKLGIVRKSLVERGPEVLLFWKLTGK